MNSKTKIKLKEDVARCLSPAAEIYKIVVFGSFLVSDSPNDMDVAVFLDRESEYLPIALKFRRLVEQVAQTIPLDIIPVRPGASGSFLDEINRGEIIYER